MTISDFVKLLSFWHGLGADLLTEQFLKLLLLLMMAKVLVFMIGKLSLLLTVKLLNLVLDKLLYLVLVKLLLFMLGKLSLLLTVKLLNLVWAKLLQFVKGKL